MSNLKLNLNIVLNGFFIAYLMLLVMIEGGLLISGEYLVLGLSLAIFAISCLYLYIDIINIKDTRDNNQELQAKLIQMNIAGAMLFVGLALFSFIEVTALIGGFATYWYITIPVLIAGLLLCPGLWLWTNKASDRKLFNPLINGRLNICLVTILFLFLFLPIAFMFRW